MGLLILFIVLAAVFGVGAIIKGIFWLALIGGLLLIAAIVVGVQVLGDRGSRV